MNYLERVAASIASQCGDTYSDSDYIMSESDRLLWLAYALLCVTKGVETTSRDVHDAWSLWASLHFPTHYSLVPFDQLTPDVQTYDDQYRDAIHAAAQEMAVTA